MTTENKMTRRDLAMLAAGAAGIALVASPAEAAQPNMNKALDHLRSAYAFLEKANDNKGGHRVKAMEYTAAAIAQVKEGIKHAD